MKILKNKPTSLFFQKINSIYYPSEKTRLQYFIIIASTLILSLIAILKGSNVYPDSYAYLSYADKIFHFNFISPYAKRTPGYPLFITLAWLILGKGFLQVIISQIIINLFSQLILVRILTKTGLANLTVLSLLLYNLSPLSYFSLNLLTETLTIFLILAIVFMLIKYNENSKASIIYYTCLLIIFLIFVRPQFIFVFISVGIFLICKRKFKYGFIIISSILFIVIFWSFINNKYNNYQGFTSLLGYNLINHTGYFIEDARELNPTFVDIYLNERKKTIVNKNGEQFFTIYNCKKKIMNKLNYNEVKLSKELLRISSYLIFKYPVKYVATVCKAFVFSLNYNNRYTTEGFVFKFLRMPAPLGLIFYLGGILVMVLINFPDNFFSILLKTIFFSNLLISFPFDLGENFRYMIPVLFIPFIFLVFFALSKKRILINVT